MADAARALCERLGALFDRQRPPARWRCEAGADGVHVGQDDMPVAEVRELVGPDMLIGPLDPRPGGDRRRRRRRSSTTSASGPVHETPTKPGRPAVGLELVRYAAAHAPVPFFAIGGLRRRQPRRGDRRRRAARVCVLRAIAEAEDPQSAARELRELLDARARWSDGAERRRRRTRRAEPRAERGAAPALEPLGDGRAPAGAAGRDRRVRGCSRSP